MFYINILTMNKFAISFLTVFFLFSCATAGVKNVEYVEFDKTTIVEKEFDDVWGYLVEWAAINSFPIESADKESGIIKLSGSGTVSWNGGANIDQSLVSCGEATGNMGLYGAKFTGMTINAVIILREVDSSTRVTVNLNGNVGVEVRNGYGVVSASRNTCPSRGIFEEKLFTDIKTL